MIRVRGRLAGRRYLVPPAARTSRGRRGLFVSDNVLSLLTTGEGSRLLWEPRRKTEVVVTAAESAIRAEAEGFGP